MFTIVTVRCGHCANLLSVNIGGASLQPPPLSPSHHHHHQDLLQLQRQQQSSQLNDQVNCKRGSSGSGGGSSTACSKVSPFLPSPDRGEPPRMAPIRPPEKRQRVPSAYNRFIKEEIQRIKTSNPHISHRKPSAWQLKIGLISPIFILA
ncbi:hypothetical protein Dimus_009292 [Dionaea muscipula]